MNSLLSAEKFYAIAGSLLFLLFLFFLHAFGRISAQNLPAAPATGKAAEQELLAKVDRDIQYPDGLYTGELLVRSQKNAQTRRWTFQLYLKHRNRLYYFFEPSARLVYKVLYSYHQKTGLSFLAWDPLRAILSKKRGKARFQRVMGSGFQFWDLALAPYSSAYRISEIKKTDEKNSKAQRIVESFPENLIDPFPEGARPLALGPRGLAPFSLVRMYVREKPKGTCQALGLDFYDRPGLLHRSLYPLYDSSVYNYATKKRERWKAPTAFRAFDFDRESLSIFELRSYNSRAKIRLPLFEPRFINR